MAQVPETRPVAMDRSLPPANDIRPMVGVYYDAAGNPQRAYMYAPPPPAVIALGGGGGAAPSSFRTVTPSDTVALPAGTQGLRFATAQTTLSIKGINDTTAVAMGPQAAGTTLMGAFGFVMATGTAPGTGIVALI